MLYRLAIVCSIIACVTALPTGRIVGGENATIDQFPHQVALIKKGSFHCGGSIIGERFILTAAHCVLRKGIETYPTTDLTIRVGSILHSSGGVLYSIEKIIVHQKYGDGYNDVAILVTTEPIISSKPIALATKDLPSGENVIISGWGVLYTGGPTPEQLQWNTVRSINTKECYDAISRNDESLICLAHAKNNGACYGDSGGPATYNNGLVTEIVGIAGFVVGGCGSSYPDGYAKVFYHKDWIMNVMNSYKAEHF